MIYWNRFWTLFLGCLGQAKVEKSHEKLLKRQAREAEKERKLQEPKLKKQRKNNPGEQDETKGNEQQAGIPAGDKPSKRMAKTAQPQESIADGAPKPKAKAKPGDKAKGSFAGSEPKAKAKAKPGDKAKGSFADGEPKPKAKAKPGDKATGSFADGEPKPKAKAQSEDKTKGNAKTDTAGKVDKTFAKALDALDVLKNNPIEDLGLPNRDDFTKKFLCCTKKFIVCNKLYWGTIYTQTLQCEVFHC